MPAETRLFQCLKDNYGVLLHDPENGATAAIDAPEAAPIEAALKATGWKLTDILVTHHHADHTGGIVALKEKYKCRVVAPAAEADTIPAVDLTVREGDKVTAVSYTHLDVYKRQVQALVKEIGGELRFLTGINGRGTHVTLTFYLPGFQIPPML